jgi:ribose transport system permease protein
MSERVPVERSTRSAVGDPDTSGEGAPADGAGAVVEPSRRGGFASSQLLGAFFNRRGDEESRRASPLERYGGLLLIAVMFVVFSLTLSSTFPTYSNLIGVVSNETIAGIMALSLLLPLAAGVFDISIGGSMTLAVILVTWLFQTTNGSMPIPLAIAITLAVGLVIGCINGLLVVKAKVDPFIATIGSSSVLLGISEAIANGTTIANNIPGGFTQIGREYVLKVPLTLAYFLVIAAILWYLLEHTPFGRRVYATGAGREAARLSGVRTDRVIFISFVASAFLATLAGAVYGANLGAGPPNVGANFLLPAYAAAFLGSTMIRPGRFNVTGLIVALFVVAIGINGLQLFGIQFWIVDLYQGVVLVVAVVLARARADKR